MNGASQAGTHGGSEPRLTLKWADKQNTHKDPKETRHSHGGAIAACVGVVKEVGRGGWFFHFFLSFYGREKERERDESLLLQRALDTS